LRSVEGCYIADVHETGKLLKFLTWSEMELAFGGLNRFSNVETRKNKKIQVFEGFAEDNS